MSVEAFQASVTLVVVAEVALRFVGCVGGVVSAQGRVETMIAVLGGAVAGCVEGVDGEGVVGAAGEAADDAGGAGGGVDEVGAVVDAVAGDADVVGGGRPGERDAGGGAGRGGDVGRRGRRLACRRTATS